MLLDNCRMCARGKQLTFSFCSVSCLSWTDISPLGVRAGRLAVMAGELRVEERRGEAGERGVMLVFASGDEGDSALRPGGAGRETGAGMVDVTGNTVVRTKCH